MAMLNPTIRKRLACGGCLILLALLLGGGWELRRWLRESLAGAHVYLPFQPSKSLDIERVGANGMHFSVNTGEAVFRLEMRREDAHSRRVFASYAEALRYAREQNLTSIPSVPLVLAACRAGDTRLQVALEGLLDAPLVGSGPVTARAGAASVARGV